MLRARREKKPPKVHFVDYEDLGTEIERMATPRSSQDADELDAIHDIPISVGVFLTLGWILLTAWYFSYTEEWLYLDALYFTFVSVTTIGKR